MIDCTHSTVGLFGLILQLCEGQDWVDYNYLVFLLDDRTKISWLKFCTLHLLLKLYSCTKKNAYKSAYAIFLRALCKVK